MVDERLLPHRSLAASAVNCDCGTRSNHTEVMMTNEEKALCDVEFSYHLLLSAAAAAGAEVVVVDNKRNSRTWR